VLRVRGVAFPVERERASRRREQWNDPFHSWKVWERVARLAGLRAIWHVSVVVVGMDLLAGSLCEIYLTCSHSIQGERVGWLMGNRWRDAAIRDCVRENLELLL